MRATGVIDPDTANRLKEQNQAHERNRAGMIWFCFFPLALRGRAGSSVSFDSGVAGHFRFLRTRSGNGACSRDDRRTVLVEVDVPIASLPRFTFLDQHLYRQFLINRD